VRGVPLVSILLAFVVGEFMFLPFPSWQALVGVVTSATAIMYAFAPVSLAALRLRDPDRHRPYHLPFPKVLAPLGFIFANLIIYWGGFDVTLKLLVAIFLGRVLFEVTLALTKPAERPDIDWRAASWIWPWLGGCLIIGLLGQYGTWGDLKVIGDGWDAVVVAAFSLVIFYFAVSVAMEAEKVGVVVDAQRAEMEAIEAEVKLAD
jgi:amino acid transporter